MYVRQKSVYIQSIQEHLITLFYLFFKTQSKYYVNKITAVLNFQRLIYLSVYGVSEYVIKKIMDITVLLELTAAFILTITHC